MGFQEILVYTALIVALGFLVKKYLWPSRAVASKKDCGHDNCGCSN